MRILVIAATLAAGMQSGSIALGDKAPPFRVIANAANPATAVSREFVERAFLKKIQRWDDKTPLRPVDLKAGNPARKTFAKQIIRRSERAIRSYWQRQIFAGRQLPPRQVSGDEAVVEYVKRTRGAIGYVSGAADVSGVKVLRIR